MEATSSDKNVDNNWNKRDAADMKSITFITPSFEQ